MNMLHPDPLPAPPSPDFVRRVEAAAAAVRAGRLALLLDDADRENEGDLVGAAALATAETVNFMKREGRGLICAAAPPERLAALHLPLMTPDNTARLSTAFTLSVDALEGTTTGISAGDMAITLRLLGDPATRAEQLGRPGHVFPLRADPGGVLRRRGQTEGSVDLCRIAGVEPVGVLCEVVADDGTMLRGPALEDYARCHELPLLHVQDLVRYRLLRERLIEPQAPARLPTAYGDFTIIGYHVPLTGEHHVALVHGEIAADRPTLVRMHSECLTGDALRSLRCDCGEQLAWSLRRIADEGSGVLLYLRQEGRGIGLPSKLAAYRLQDEGLDTVDANLALGLPADSRDYSIAAQILRDLGAARLRLITNNPHKLAGMETFGLEVVERVPVPLEVMYDRANEDYLRVKSERMGHLYDLAERRSVQEDAVACTAWKWG